MENMVPVNYLAVIAAAVVSMITGFLWYGPLFGKMWIQEMGWSKADMTEARKKGMAKQYLLMFVGSLIMSWVFVHPITFASEYTGVYGAQAGLTGGFFNWLGFVMPVTLSSVLWEGKSWKLWCITNGYYLVTLMAMGVVLAVWR